MQKAGLRPYPASALGWTLFAVAALFIAGWLIGPRHGAGERSPADRIVVVGAGDGVPSIQAASSVTPGAPAAPATSPDAAVAHISRTYPMLTEIALQCPGDRCTLTATIPPPVGQHDLDRRQEMLLGGLAASLKTDGYTMQVPFQFDEVADNTFHVRAVVDPD